MARTAPVPNIPPIPGMCPGMVVLAGNGDGGGESGKGGKGGKGKDGADAKKGENDPNGDGKNAKCGGSGPQKCADHEGASAGDPVEVATGRVYTQIYVDVAWPGPLPFSFRRKYSSNLGHRDVGIGFGWTHSMAWELLVRGKLIEVWNENGSKIRYRIPRPGAAEAGKDGSLLERDGPDFLVHEADLVRRFEPADATGRRFRLKSISDPRHNTIALQYDEQGRLGQITDCVGRVLRVRTNPQGRISSLEAATQSMGHVTFAQFRYDDRGNLASHTDGENQTSRFTYHDEHLLASHTAPGSLTFHYRYDDSRRCVETWGAFEGGGTPALAPDTPKVLADGVTRAKGMLHAKVVFYPDGFREVIDSMTIRRFFVGSTGNVTKNVSNGKVSERIFDQVGRLVRFVDQLGSVYSWTYDPMGNVLTETDAAGNITTYVRDDNGREVAVADSLGTIATTRYDHHGNAVELTLSRRDTVHVRHNSQGLPIEFVRPDGARIVQEWDAHGNRVKVVQPDGAIWQWSYDEFGNEISATDPGGGVTRTRFNLLRKPIERTFPSGDTERYDYSPSGDLIYVGDGKRATRFDWDGMHLLTRRTFDDGSALQYRYNREGYLTQILNERGEVRRTIPNEDGLLVGIDSFDGRRQRLKRDAIGRVVELENGDGKTRFERNAMGQILKIEHPDGTADSFEYDLRGRLLKASNDLVELCYTLDAAGLVTRETQRVAEEEHFVDYAYDVLRERVGTKTSLGYAADYGRTLGREIDRITLDGHATLQFQRDVRGYELARRLPGGAVVTSEFDPAGRLSRRALHAAGPPPTVGPAEPEWVGARDPAAAILKAFQFQKSGLIARYDRGRGATSYQQDARGRLSSVVRDGQVRETYQHDVTNNLFANGEPRAYGKGNVLLEKGAAKYVWNDDGQLVEKRVARDDGDEDVFTYQWGGNRLLSSVTRPDGTRVEFDYDPFARRVVKRIVRDDEVLARTRYVWDGPVIVHEIRETAGVAGDPVVEERTYAWGEQRAWEPIGHRDVARGGDTGATKGDWRFYVSDDFGTPEEIVTGDGRVVGALEREAYGKTRLVAGDVDTSLRLPGQYEDPETGLFYNRYRYYDPDAGRYISEDASGEFPDANLFRYTTNPLHNGDLDGLHEADWTYTPPGASSPSHSGSEHSSFSNVPSNMMPTRAQSHLVTDPATGQPTPASRSRACASAFATNRCSDTEAKITRDRLGNLPPHQQRGHLNVNGELPPCPRCHRRMQQWANDNNATATYNWPRPGNGNSVTFSPHAAPTGSGPGAAAVANRPIDPSFPNPPYP